MRAHLELFARLLVDMRRTEHRELFDAGRQRDRPTHLRPGALCRADDFLCRLVQHPVIEGLKPDANMLTIHLPDPSPK